MESDRFKVDAELSSLTLKLYQDDGYFSIKDKSAVKQGCKKYAV